MIDFLAKKKNVTWNYIEFKTGVGKGDCLFTMKD